MTAVDIYTHGCAGPDERGGWAAILVQGPASKTLSGAQRPASSAAMEMTACVEALTALKRPCSVRLHVANDNLRKAFTEGWLQNWKAANWKIRPGHRLLWEALDTLIAFHEVEWVEADRDHPQVRCCQKLSRQARAS